MPTADFWLEPEKITSSSRRARTLRDDCSPRTQRIDSATLLLPVPLGPTMAVMPGAKSNSVLLLKLLKPCSSRRFRYMAHLGFAGPGAGGRGPGQVSGVGWQV